MGILDHILLCTEAARDNDLAVLGQGFADRGEGLLDRGIDESAGIDNNQIGAGIARRGGIAFGTQLREDALGVDQRLGTAERDEPDLRTCRDRSCSGCQRENRGRRRR